MHIADFGIGMLGANGIVAGGISIMTGAELATQMDGNGRAAVSFLGDGASNRVSSICRPIRSCRSLRSSATSA